ncbi:MAG: hypothetical protein N3B16_06440 [Candidatus Aminicenantes bacterium]|nr:hypothetical protein [Candidatus Aminicenantes bacterium]
MAMVKLYHLLGARQNSTWDEVRALLKLIMDLTNYVHQDARSLTAASISSHGPFHWINLITRVKA